MRRILIADEPVKTSRGTGDLYGGPKSVTVVAAPWLLG